MIKYSPDFLPRKWGSCGWWAPAGGMAFVLFALLSAIATTSACDLRGEQASVAVEASSTAASSTAANTTSPTSSSPTSTSPTSPDDSEEMKRWKRNFDKKILPILQQKCFECHNEGHAEGELDLSGFKTGDDAANNLDMWERVAKRIRLNEMPPEGSPQLDDPQKGAFNGWLDSMPSQDLCSKLATDETQAWYRGVVMSRRLTRTEYLNAVRDVVGLPVAERFEIPSDGAGGEGFDTNGDSLFTSPIHIEQYLAAAVDVIHRALPVTEPNADTDLATTETTAATARLLLATPDTLAAASEGAPAGEHLPGKSWWRQAAEINLKQFARRAWRRPIQEREVQRLLELFDAGAERETSFVSALRQPLIAILVSPNFLFVVENEDPAGGVQRLTQHQLATRLALFLWSSVPDESLLNAADQGQLETQQQLIAETRRMLADPKADALGENFGLQWLGLANFLQNVQPDQEVFPDFDSRLAADLRREAVMTVSHVLRHDRSLLELVSADYVFANDRLADHYDLPANVGWTAAKGWSSETGFRETGFRGKGFRETGFRGKGQKIEPARDASWRKISLHDQPRGGVITLGAILASTSYPRRTSPVLRGRWLLEEILGDRVPPPPPGVPALEEADTHTTTSMRERLELHRKNAECASCHNRMDPLGFGLENFDALGRWREQDNGAEIDASGTLPSGQTFSGPQALKQILLERSDDFKKHFTRKLLGFALGRELNKFDDCVIEDSLKAMAQDNDRASVIIETIVTSYPFQHRYFKAPE